MEITSKTDDLCNCLRYLSFTKHMFYTKIRIVCEIERGFIYVE